MNTLNISLEDIESPGYIAQIGFVGENECTQVAINCSDVFFEYPTALPSLTVKSPKHCEPYPSIVERNDSLVVWTVTNANLTEDGIGEFQLTFTVGNVVKKSYTGKYRVKKSLMPTGPVPDPLDDFITRAGIIVSQIQQTITDTLLVMVPQWARQPAKPDYTAEEVGALPDDTFIPSKVSDLVDDSGHYTKPSSGIPASDLAAGVIPDITVKADKVQNAVNGHLAALDVTGNLIDSGKYAFDFLTVSQLGAINGVAELDPNGKVPASQLPSFVDDVLEFATASILPRPGETGKIYVVKDTDITYRWSGSTYIEIGSSLALGETSSTAYRGDRGALAYGHATDVLRSRSFTSNGFFKIGATDEGHVSSLIPVNKQDIENLGIPGDITGKADKADTVLDTTLSRGRKDNTTVGTGSFAFGDHTEASGEYSHSEGAYTTANGANSHAEGNSTSANGEASHSEGLTTVADGSYSHAEGMNTIAKHKSQHVFGEYNVQDTSENESTSRGIYVEIVGNGIGSNTKSNARSLDWDGNERLMGDVYVGCNANSTGGTKLAKITDVPDVKELKVYKIAVQVGGNVTDTDVTRTGTKGISIIFTDNARVIGYNAEHPEYLKNLTYTISPGLFEHSVTIRPGAVNQEVEFYVAETEVK